VTKNYTLKEVEMKTEIVEVKDGVVRCKSKRCNKVLMEGYFALKIDGVLFETDYKIVCSCGFEQKIPALFNTRDEAQSKTIEMELFRCFSEVRRPTKS